MHEGIRIMKSEATEYFMIDAEDSHIDFCIDSSKIEISHYYMMPADSGDYWAIQWFAQRMTVAWIGSFTVVNRCLHKVSLKFISCWYQHYILVHCKNSANVFSCFSSILICANIKHRRVAERIYVGKEVAASFLKKYGRNFNVL